MTQSDFHSPIAGTGRDSRTNVMTDDKLRQRQAKHRQLLIWLGWSEAFAVVAIAIMFLSPGTGGDPAGLAIGQGILILMSLILGVFVAPALLLAHLDRKLGISFTLLLFPAFLMLLLAGAVF